MRPAVRGQTNRYNSKIRLGRGFTRKELVAAGVNSLDYARSIGIAVDVRRKDTSNETLKLNANRLKDYLSRVILYPEKLESMLRNPLLPKPNPKFLQHQKLKTQNTHAQVLPLPKSEVGYSFTTITKEMKDNVAFKTLRTELKTSKGFYKRLEAIKKRGGKK